MTARVMSWSDLITKVSVHTLHTTTPPAMPAAPHDTRGDTAIDKYAGIPNGGILRRLESIRDGLEGCFDIDNLAYEAMGDLEQLIVDIKNGAL